MKKSIELKRSERGFTLLEVIVIIVIASILGSLLFTFMGTAITKSAIPVKQTRDLGELIGNIETITAAYASYLTGGKTWDGTGGFKELAGNTPTVVVIDTDVIGTETFDIIRVTATKGDQKLVSYFTQ